MRYLRKFFAPVCVLAGTAAVPRAAAAQDPFEIEVYPYHTAERGEWELDAHLNYTATGTTDYDGLVAPTEHQAHLALELTTGITELWEAGAYVLSAYRPGVGVEYAGWRLRSRVRFPESWRLPVLVSLGAELEFTRAPYDENAAGLEIRPTLGRRFGRLQVDLNPVLERGLRGQGSGRGEDWEFEPSARVGLTLSKVVDVSLEYYGKTGLFDSEAPAGGAAHQFYPSVDLKLGEDFECSIGVGAGTTAAANRLVLKSRFEFPLGK